MISEGLPADVRLLGGWYFTGIPVHGLHDFGVFFDREDDRLLLTPIRGAGYHRDDLPPVWKRDPDDKRPVGSHLHRLPLHRQVSMGMRSTINHQFGINRTLEIVRLKEESCCAVAVAGFDRRSHWAVESLFEKFLKFGVGAPGGITSAHGKYPIRIFGNIGPVVVDPLAATGSWS